MEEEDYINLQNLLIKLRVHLFKEISDNNLKPKYRDKDIKMIRNIDNLRNNVPIMINEK